MIFVSHDMSAISRLCDRAFWLDGGRVMQHGPSEEVVAAYLQGATGSGAEVAFDGVASDARPQQRLRWGTASWHEERILHARRIHRAADFFLG